MTDFSLNQVLFLLNKELARSRQLVKLNDEALIGYSHLLQSIVIRVLTGDNSVGSRALSDRGVNLESMLPDILLTKRDNVTKVPLQNVRKC